MEIWFVWLARLMFLGIFLLGGGMLFRAWKVALKRDMRFVADWRGKTLTNAPRWAMAVFSINLVGGLVLLAVGFSVLLFGLEFVLWTGTAGLVLWTYYFALRLLASRAAREATTG